MSKSTLQITSSARGVGLGRAAPARCPRSEGLQAGRRQTGDTPLRPRFYRFLSSRVSFRATSKRRSSDWSSDGAGTPIVRCSHSCSSRSRSPFSTASEAPSTPSCATPVSTKRRLLLSRRNGDDLRNRHGDIINSVLIATTTSAYLVWYCWRQLNLRTLARIGPTTIVATRSISARTGRIMRSPGLLNLLLLCYLRGRSTGLGSYRSIDSVPLDSGTRPRIRSQISVTPSVRIPTPIRISAARASLRIRSSWSRVGSAAS